MTDGFGDGEDDKIVKSWKSQRSEKGEMCAGDVSPVAMFSLPAFSF